MKVVILAGGLGTRISEESHLKPKPMIEVGGLPILWHIMKIYSHFGYNDFVICCGYKGHIIKEYFANYYLHRSDVTFDFSNQNEMIVHNNIAEPWKVTVVDTGVRTQTGGRIRRIRRYVDGAPFHMTYGDGVANLDLNALVEQHMQSDNVVTLTGIQPGGRFGVLEVGDEENVVLGFSEKSTDPTGWISGGFMVMNPEVFDYLPDDDCVLERKPLETLSKQRKLGVYRHTGYWQCMDTQRDKGFLENHWAENNAPWKVWDDV